MRQHPYIIKTVSSKKLKDYDGMNYYAGKKLGYHIEKKNIIHIRSGLSKKDRTKTINHEITEAEMMKKGFSYWTSHDVALKSENKRVKLPSGRYIKF